ncbi:MAG TPA: hypothetical protein VIH85_26285 [Solirubrobacteraceae bacterium]
MQTHEASRTLVKSPPELWAECSDAAALARHLDGFGEIRITRLDPETAVAWEGEKVRGTVRIEPAGWGTKVILTAEAAVAEEEVHAPAPEPMAATEAVEVIETVEAVEAVEAVGSPEPLEPLEPLEPPPETPAARRRRFARLRAFFRGPEPVEAAPEPVPAEVVPDPAPDQAPPEIEASEPEPEPEPPPPAAPDGAEAALSAALDSLGQAHHRPYSRA